MGDAQEALDNFPSVYDAKLIIDKANIGKYINVKDYDMIVFRAYWYLVREWSKKYVPKKKTGITERFIELFRIE